MLKLKYMEDNITELNCQSLVIDGNEGNVKITYTPSNTRVSIEAHDVLALSENSLKNLPAMIQGKMYYIDTVAGKQIILLIKIKNFYSKLSYKALINKKSITLFSNVHMINDTGRKIISNNVTIKNFTWVTISEEQKNIPGMLQLQRKSKSIVSDSVKISEEQYVNLNLGQLTLIPSLEYVIPLENIEMIPQNIYFVHNIGSYDVDCVEEVLLSNKVFDSLIEFYDKNMISISTGRIESGLANTITRIHHYNNKVLTIVESTEGMIEGHIIIQNNTNYEVKFIYTHSRMEPIKKSIKIKANEIKEINEPLIKKET